MDTHTILTFEFVDEGDHSNKSYYVVLPSGTVYYAVLGSSNLVVCE